MQSPRKERAVNTTDEMQITEVPQNAPQLPRAPGSALVESGNLEIWEQLPSPSHTPRNWQHTICLTAVAEASHAAPPHSLLPQVPQSLQPRVREGPQLAGLGGLW